MKKNTETKVFVDAINGTMSRLLIGDEGTQVEMPAKFLPEGTKEGDWLSMSFRPRPEIRENSRGETQDLLDSLGDICK